MVSVFNTAFYSSQSLRLGTLRPFRSCLRGVPETGDSTRKKRETLRGKGFPTFLRLETLCLILKSSIINLDASALLIRPMN
jgi:hypothetical protein